MKKQLSLVELAVSGYDSARVNRGSWLEQTFGNKNEGMEKDERTGRPYQDKSEQTG